MQKIIYIIVLFFSVTLFAQKQEKILSTDESNKKPIDIEQLCPLGESRWYRDLDGDGFGDRLDSLCATNQPQGYVDNKLDCNDNNADATILTWYYTDNDGDGFGSGLPTRTCIPPLGSVTVGGDCNDNDPSITNTGSTWYQDTDNDGFGNPNVSTTNCIMPTGYVTDNTDNCPDVYGLDNGCPPGGNYENMNWVFTKTFDIEGGITSNSKSYFDELGKVKQTQSLDIKTGKTWAAHTMYDSQGRPALQTLSAPINSTGQFLYNPNFIKKTNGSIYVTNDFETNEENPASVGNQVNSLGWYYSQNNTSEPYQDVTNFPFVRSIYSKLNPGSGLKTIGGNKVDIDNNGTYKWINGFTYSMPAAQEMYYVFGKGHFGVPNIIEESEEIITKFHKTVNIDVHGVEAVSFTDGEGKLLAVARSGGDIKYDVLSVIGKQGFVDIHIPKGIVNSDIQFLGNVNNYKIFDLRTEQIVSSSQMTGGNFYRVEYLAEIENTQSFIAANGDINVAGNVKGIRYKVNYYNYALNYYDKAGRLTKTTQYNGFDQTSLDLTAELPNHEMVSSYKYNSLNQILEVSDPDEGQVNFTYREDGQIRYSQDSEQALKNEFSYTNYDDLGRPIENGVYNGPLSFGSSSLKTLTIIDDVNIKPEGNKISKLPSEGWNSGLATIKKINGNGYISWRFALEDIRAMVGLSDINANYNYNTIKYAIYAKDGQIKVFESGLEKGTFGIFSSNDVFKIERVGSTVYYKKNESTFYTSTVSSTENLLGDFSLYSKQAKILDFAMGGNIVTPSVSPLKNAINVSINGGTIIKNGGIDTDWDSGVNTTQTIRGDGSIQFQPIQADKNLMVGLSSRTSVGSTSYGYIDFAIFLNASSRFIIYESGNYIGDFGAYNSSDYFKVQRIGSSVQYLKNNVVFYTSTKFSFNKDLVGDISIRNTNAGINNLLLSGSGYHFKDYRNVVTSDTEIRKISSYSWDAGFASSETIDDDGFVEFISPKNTNHFMLGLSTDNTNSSYNTIDFALYLHRNQRVYVYESGSSKGEKSRYEPGDTFKVERIGNTIRYYKNNEIIYTSLSTSSNPLVIDASFYEAETYIENLRFYDIIDASSVVSVDSPLNTNYCKDQYFTVYDIPQGDLSAALNVEGISSLHYQNQNFVAGNISKTYTKNPNTATTWYSYDIYGRIEWMIQKIDGLGTKTIDYEYDPIKGVVTKVIYQKHKPNELFVHKYDYNSVGELVEVATSIDNLNFSTNATYAYSETGDLKRTVLGNNIQGIDYVYNLAGQLKAINHPSLNNSKDPGGDYNDAFGMQIDYYDGDFNRNNTPKPIVTTPQGSNRYDGKIKATRWAIKGVDVSPNTTHNAYTYYYDNNKWLQNAQFGSANNSGIITENSNSDYEVSNITYDANGNILTLNRNKNTISNNNDMDDFTYHYNGLTNRLNHVSDADGDANVGDLVSQPNNNYIYNSIGQLVKNTQDDIEYFYNDSGLVVKVEKNEEPFINLYYNDRGHRVRKEVTNDSGANWHETYYVRDLAGDVLAIYEGAYGTFTTLPLAVKEYPIYGSSRLGILTKNTGIINYEVTDHLGNVRAVVSDATSNNTYSDYYPFGMPMPGRNIANDYRYAFQGQELDSETGKEAFQLRLWDGRIGRWLTTDSYGQYMSPYMGMGNNPISRVDPDGGSDCDSPPCDPPLIQLAEVNLFYSHSRKNFDFSGMHAFQRESMDWWQSSFNGTLSDYNNLYSTNFTHGGKNGAALNQWAYQFYYKPQYDDMISSMHGATSLAAEIILETALAIAPLPKLGMLKYGGKILRAKNATNSTNYVYRALNKADRISLSKGNGLVAKAPNGPWSLEQHLISGSSKQAWTKSPWISTTLNQNIAKSFSSGNSMVRINLAKLPKSSIHRGFQTLPRASKGYHYSVWQQEVSIFGRIPQNAIEIIRF